MTVLDQQALAHLIRWAGAAHFGVLVASSLVPGRLRWTAELAGLPRILRQLFWVYGGYIVLSITAFGLISLLNAHELTAGSRLARSFCAFVAVFWSIRLSLQAALDVRPHLTAWWMRLGYHALTLVFASFVLIYGYAASGLASR